MRVARSGGWLQRAGALGLFVSLFLTWSHQYSSSLATSPGLAGAFTGVPRDATAWQVYSVADVLYVLLALGLLATVAVGFGRARWPAAVACLAALAFTLHAVSVPPTKGADVLLPTTSPPQYASALAGAGVGETVAIAALGVALGGLLLSAYPRSPDVRNSSRQAARAP